MQSFNFLQFLSLLLALQACACQFINSPLPFDPLDTYVAPTGTSAITFGGTSTFISLDTSSTQFPVNSPYSSVPSQAGVFASTSDLVHTEPPSEVHSTFNLSPTLSTSPSVPWDSQSSHASPNTPPNAAVVTVMDTFYTTVSCSTTTTPSPTSASMSLASTTSASPAPDSLTPSQSSSDLSFHHGPIPPPHVTFSSEPTSHPSHVSTSQSVSDTNKAAPTAQAICSAQRSTIYATSTIYTVKTETETVFVKTTSVLTVSL